jgi:hypothetical protein
MIFLINLIQSLQKIKEEPLCKSRWMNTHEPYCRWYTVGGQFERAKIVMSEMIRHGAQKLPMIVCSEDAIIERVVRILPSDAVISVTSPDGIHPTILKEQTRWKTTLTKDAIQNLVNIINEVTN